MFRPVPMLQLSALVLVRDQRAVLKDWGRLGAVQLLAQPAGLDAPALVLADTAAELARCERLLEGIGALRQSLVLADVPLQSAGKEELTLAEAETRLQALETRARALLRQRDQLLRRWGELEAVREQVSAYCGLGLPLETPEQFEFLHFVTGSLPAGQLEHLPVGKEVALLPLIPEDPTAPGQRQRLVAMTTRAGAKALEQALARAGFEPEPLPASAGATVDSLAEENQREAAALAAELEQTQDRVRRLAAELAPSLAALARVASTERRLLEAEQNLPHTEAAVLLSGWVPAAAAPAVEGRLRELTHNRCVLERAAPEHVPEEQVPVLLEHSRWLRPFERLVSGYGLPLYSEVEPTLFVALSFLLMFGMMFGDVGQGAVLAVAGLLGFGLGRSSRLREAGLLLLYCGLSSIAFGLVYGSYFGLPALKRYALWHDPLEGDPLQLMLSAMGLGVALLSLGVVLNAVNHFRHGDLLGGFLDKFGVLGVLFYWGMLALITNYAAAQSKGLVTQALLLFFVLPVAGWTLKEPLDYARHHLQSPAPSGVSQGKGNSKTSLAAGLFAAAAESLVEAFEGLLSYLANTISFVRLAAYALSHAALLMATFLLAAQVHEASAAGSVLVIILGNVVSVVLEGVIASVQALRLEYYEFFGKFFSGAGRAFEPFRLAS